MHSRGLALGLVVLCWSAGAALAQVDSNVAVTSFAQSRGNPCSSRGAFGCGGCYPNGVANDLLSQLITINPEWAPIGPMISAGFGADPSLPPASAPVTLTGTVVLTKINQGGDFPGTHVTDDQNTFIDLDPASAGFLATGNGGSPSCPGEGCNYIEMEREIGKYPLFAWAGEGDRITAVGRWIFDCGHPDAAPLGGCQTDNTVACIIDADCQGTCNTTCSNKPAMACSNGSQCAFGACNNPAPNFNYRAEMHAPQAIVVLRNKGVGKIPGSQADVYISPDSGGAGDTCTVKHLADANDVLAKQCFLNHCSDTIGRSCKTNKDCPGGETCQDLDPSGRLTNINASDIEFDMPLPAPPPGASTIKDLKIKAKAFKPKGGLMPKPIFTLNLMTPALHVKVPMSTMLPTGDFPNVFAERIAAGWKNDTTSLTKVRVTFKSVTINNPLKPNTPAFSRQCFSSNSGGPTNIACTRDSDCPASGMCFNSSAPCINDSSCAKGDFCTEKTYCSGGIIPGWMLYAEANGDWGQLSKLQTVGAAAPFAAPPYVAPATPVPVKVALKFDEYVPAGGTIHISTTGASLGCLDTLYGNNLSDAIGRYGFSFGAACLLQMPQSTGRIDITHSDPNFATVSGATCSGPDSKGLLTCSATSTGGDGGTCTVTPTRLCISDTDCGTVCSVTGGACGVNGDCKHCSNDATKFCAQDSDCGAGNTCDANVSETCGNSAGTCTVTGGSFTLNYTVQKK